MLLYSINNPINNFIFISSELCISNKWYIIESSCRKYTKNQIKVSFILIILIITLNLLFFNNYNAVWLVLAVINFIIFYYFFLRKRQSFFIRLHFTNYLCPFCNNNLNKNNDKNHTSVMLYKIYSHISRYKLWWSIFFSTFIPK